MTFSNKRILLSGLGGLVLGATSALAAANRYYSRPYLHRAQHELQDVQHLLKQVTHDCGGHRTAAAEKVATAIREINAAVSYADSHPQEDTKH